MGIETIAPGYWTSSGDELILHSVPRRGEICILMVTCQRAVRSRWIVTAGRWSELSAPGELLTEGFVREIISKIQTMRKEAGFEVMDKIKVTYDGSEKAEKVFAEYAEQIGQETLAVAVEKAEPAGYVKDWKINGEAVNMGVEKQGE